MKKIEAFVKVHRLDDVSLALHRIETLGGMTVTDARGFGRKRGDNPDPADFHHTVRIEVFCSDQLAPTIVDTIEKAAHTGLRGDGKVYVIPVEEAVRISTGERGKAAL
jgi:nitrogen regulatory protein PII